jgi:CRP/FNR family transcriptional regulator, cyclic AMP receptor protein
MADRYLRHLAAMPLFRECSKKELRQIARLADEIDVEEGRVLITQGETGHEAFVIVEGTASVTRDGKEIVTLGRGDPFGEMALIDKKPRNATVIAASPMKVLVIGKREFNGLMEEAPDFRDGVMASLAARLREADLQGVS